MPLPHPHQGEGHDQTVDLEDLTTKELKEKAAEAGIPGRSQMSKDELVEALEDAEEVVEGERPLT